MDLVSKSVSRCWWMVAALAGCAAAPGGTADESDSEGPDSVFEDGIDARVACGDQDTLQVSADEFVVNGAGEAEVAAGLLSALGSTGDNMLVSPTSLRTVFGQVYAGAEEPARTEIGEVLALADSGERIHAVLGGALQTIRSREVAKTEDQEPLVFRPANRAFFDSSYAESVEPEWLDIAQRNYGICLEFFAIGADIEASRKHINGWVAEQTETLIPELLPALDPSAALVLVNALYFKASWATPFSGGWRAPFTTRSGEQIEVDVMQGLVTGASYAAADGWQAVAVPYADSRLEMVVVVPDDDTVAAFEQSLDGPTLAGMFDALVPTAVDLQLPKFKVQINSDLVAPLQQLGLSAPFTDGATFAGIAPGIPPIVQIFHDVAVAIDEKGTEAAAATAIVFGDDGAVDEPSQTVVVDHTFYFAIRDVEARSILFFGRIGDPSKSS